ncbi:hypothetical protein [Nonlabens ulvanivorans]|uniref:Uncharacterized protein n=1 Tax=Nonlabens ulvanivorans TaxID=906888 RepID=A0A084JXS1_NONUL|nr:hypothetical protein [Nonlabens ulvanivorans]KEZ93755.1 hypothetical protein IL45_06005 [Nonlabens ulvanivorans]PRX14350.1 hypothetical protein LY02_01380 [Nonlabens ulvanivorans]
MILSDIKLRKQGQLHVLECLLNKERLYFETSHIVLIDEKELIYDAFVIAVIPLMIEKKESLIVKGLMDATLQKQLNEIVIPKLLAIHQITLNLTINCSKTSINHQLQNNSIATGISCGVDSFATIKSFKEHSKKLDYLTFFNAGSHGAYDTQNSKINYKHRLLNATRASQELGREMIKVETNAHSFLSGRFKSAHSFLNLSCAFATLGLLNHYHYASAYSLRQSSEQSGDTSNFDHIILPQLFASYFSTQSTLGNMNRVERVGYISTFKTSHKYLDVCTNSMIASLLKKQNCTSCEKCMRTAATLDILGVFNKYHEVFCLDTYRKNKRIYLSRLLTGKNSIHDEELLELYREKKQIKMSYYLNGHFMRIKAGVKKLIKRN